MKKKKLGRKSERGLYIRQDLSQSLSINVAIRGDIDQSGGSPNGDARKLNERKP
tara:strand:+ start:609 stop:770 length:162 start_codon:yes stop_codon:yes gene_type:complete